MIFLQKINIIAAHIQINGTCKKWSNNSKFSETHFTLKIWAYKKQNGVPTISDNLFHISKATYSSDDQNSLSIKNLVQKTFKPCALSFNLTKLISKFEGSSFLTFVWNLIFILQITKFCKVHVMFTTIVTCNVFNKGVDLLKL